jgi:hypothetical protein
MANACAGLDGACGIRTRPAITALFLVDRLLGKAFGHTRRPARYREGAGKQSVFQSPSITINDRNYRAF